VAELLLASNADVHATNNLGETPLHFAAMFGRNAAMKGHTDVAELLLANKADVNARDNHGASPLFFAALNGNKDMVKLLLVHGADVNAKGNDGSTPLHEANWAADHAKQTVVGEKPLPTAEISKYSDVVDLLRQHGGHE
jgi:cytohesin